MRMGRPTSRSAFNPLAIAIDAAGNVYVVNPTARGYVQRFSADGTLLESWGSSGQGPGELSGANGIAAGPNGDLYVADSGNDRIQELALDGSFVGQWPSSNPRDVATDTAGNVYIVGDTQVRKFSARGLRSANGEPLAPATGSWESPTASPSVLTAAFTSPTPTPTASSSSPPTGAS